LWAFFDSAYRTRVDVDYFAARWRKAGIAALHVAAWHNFEPDPEADAYLKKLIEACHREGILVYAWFELPHVSERFWADHAAWREQTALLQDAQLDWRKLMNLTNRECFRAVSAGVRAEVARFDWDGVNLAELYFESLEGINNPSRFTPMNADVRAQFRQLAGFDPVELYTTRADPGSRRAFLDFRAGLVIGMQKEWLAELDLSRHDKPNLDVVLTHVDDRLDTGMRDAIGADAARVLPLLDSRSFTFLIEDPATVWNLGPERYAAIAERYCALTSHTAKLAIDVNIVERYQNVYPTKQQTGTELFQLVHRAAASFPRVALYSENSLLPPDLKLLPSAAAAVSRMELMGPKTVIDSAGGVGIPWAGGARVDGELWPVQDDEVLWLPAGAHAVEAVPPPGGPRVVYLNGDLKAARAVDAHTSEFTYQSAARAIAILSRLPVKVRIDGVDAAPQWAGPYTVLLPRGQHFVTLTTD
jgi:quinol monooxygenase YgiN